MSFWAAAPAADSAQMLVYKETDKARKNALSDHCPVSVRLVAN